MRQAAGLVKNIEDFEGITGYYDRASITVGELVVGNIDDDIKIGDVVYWRHFIEHKELWGEESMTLEVEIVYIHEN